MQGSASRRLEQRAIPHRSNPGATRAPRAGEGRELPAICWPISSRPPSTRIHPIRQERVQAGAATGAAVQPPARADAPERQATRRVAAARRLADERAVAVELIPQRRGALAAPVRGVEAGVAAISRAIRLTTIGKAGIGQNGCHDITSYPALGYAGGACAGYGLLFDIRDTKNPKRVGVAADSNMAFWHSATFSNDGTKLLFSDEWGGGSAPRCRATDPLNWGGNAIFTLDNGQMHFKSYYKMPAPQADNETCTAHNGSLIPVPGRDIMVQAFYQGGATVFDWTDAAHPMEIAFFDRGPGGGYWSVYWYNGVIVANDERRGMDIHELVASPYLSQNEIDAAKSIKLDQFNAQQTGTLCLAGHVRARTGIRGSARAQLRAPHGANRGSAERLVGRRERNWFRPQQRPLQAGIGDQGRHGNGLGQGASDAARHRGGESVEGEVVVSLV